MSCNAEIETETIKDVVSVPIQSVTARSSFEGEKNQEESEDAPPPQQTGNNKPDNKPKEIVFIVQNGKAKTIEVETGISDDNYIQIKRVCPEVKK
jgi:HlyD family secretion protein